MKTKLKKKLKFLLKLLVTIGFAVWVIYTTRWSDVWFYIREIKIWQLFLYAGVLFAGFFISSYKWKLLANFKNIHLSHWEFFKLYFAGTFINNFMPSFIAGDAYKAYEIGKKNEVYSEAASTVMMDRITGLIGATMLALLFSLLNLTDILKNKALIIANILLLISFGFDLLMPYIRKIVILRKLIFRFAPEKIVTFLKELASFSRDRKIIFRAINYSILFSLIGVALLNYILFLALGIKINLLDFLSVIFLIAIISSLPISINNIGIKEWAYITFFSAFGVDPAGVLTVAIVSRSVQMAVSFFALPIYLKRKNN